jgi:hypothetical protein
MIVVRFIFLIVFGRNSMIFCIVFIDFSDLQYFIVVLAFLDDKKILYFLIITRINIKYFDSRNL